MSANPLPHQVRCLGLLLMLIVSLRSGGYGFPRHLPFLEFLDEVGAPGQWNVALQCALYGGTALAWFGGFVRAGALLSGAAMILRVIGNMPAYSNGTLFTGLILVLIGLYTPLYGLAFLRAQCILLYAGAALSKCFDADWFNGRFVSAMLDFHLSPWLAAALSPLAVPAGIAAVWTEATIAVTLMVPRWRNFGVAIAALFHTFLLVLLNEDFGTFFYSVALSTTLLFLSLPEVQSVSGNVPGWARDSVFAPLRDGLRQRWQAGDWSVRFAGGALSGIWAQMFLIGSSLPALSAALSTAALLGYFEKLKPRTFLLAAAVAISFLLWARYKMSGNETNPISAGADSRRAEPQSFRQSAGGD
jgi:hypothetical protein